MNKNLHEICLGIVKDVEAAAAGGDLIDWINDSSLGDVVYEVSRGGGKGYCVRGGRVLVCFGGPNVWLHDDCIKGFWGSDSVMIPLNKETRGALFDLFCEMFEF